MAQALGSMRPHVVVEGGGFGGLDGPCGSGCSTAATTISFSRCLRNGFPVLLRWAWAYITWPRGARLKDIPIRRIAE